MRLADEFGIVTQARERRAAYGNRVTHGTTVTMRLPQPIYRPTTMATNKPASDHWKVAKESPFASIVRRDPAMLYEVAYPQAHEATADLDIPVRDLLKIVCDVTQVDRGDVLSARRTRELTRPRQVIMYLARKHTPHSLPAIGRVLKRDHTTILAGCERMRKLLAAQDDWSVRIVAEAEIELLMKYGHKARV